MMAGQLRKVKVWVKRVRAEADGFVQLVSEPIWDVWSQSRWYESIETGTAPTRLEVKVSPDCKVDYKEADFVGFGSVGIVASPSVESRLVSILDKSCHCIELVSPKKNYKAYLPRIFYDAFDAEKSEYDRFDDESQEISKIRTTVLRNAGIGQAPVFKVLGDRACRTPTFVSEHFFDLYKEVKATGLIFYDVELSQK